MSEKFYGLEEISIRNLGVIESANIELEPGLNVLTGETGAGKTMVLTALGLILGGKSDADRVRTGSERAHVSAIFSLDKKTTSALGDDVVLEDGNLLISRTISPDGKSRINIGGETSTASKASEIGSLLVEVHAQSSTQRLTKPVYVRQILDSFARNEEIAQQVADVYNEHLELSARIKALRADQSNRSEEIENIKEFLKAFTAITPKEGEFRELNLQRSQTTLPPSRPDSPSHTGSTFQQKSTLEEKVRLVIIKQRAKLISEFGKASQEGMRFHKGFSNFSSLYQKFPIFG